MAVETVLVTGASAGLGVEFARLFAADGSELVLVARRADRLRDLAGEIEARHGARVHVVPTDLAEPEAARRLVERLERDGIAVDVLVNNAGFGARGPLAAVDARRQADMVQVNVQALTGLTGLLLPGMLARGGGGILNVASMAGFVPGPYMTTYYATKAYVLSFTEALAEELRGTGVKVSCLCPGPVATEFAERAGLQDSLAFRMRAANARRVARAGYEGLRANRTIVVPGLRNRLGLLAVRLVPRAVVRKAIKAIQR